jgi:hypothetical protein
MAGNAPIWIKADFSDDETINFALDLTDANGAVLDLTGYTLDYSVKDRDGCQVLALSEGSGITIDRVLGRVFYKAAAGSLPVGSYEHGSRLKSTTDANQKAQFFDGPLIIGEGAF